MDSKAHIATPLLDYGAPRKYSRLRRWFRPGAAGFNLVVLVLSSVAAWQAWKWSLAADEKAFNERAREVNWYALPWIEFEKPPDAGSLRHLARRPGAVTLFLGFDDPADGSVARAFSERDWTNISEIEFGQNIVVDHWMKEITRPDSGLGCVQRLAFQHATMSGPELAALARPDSGLTGLRTLDLFNSRITDAPLKEFARPDSGLRGLTTLILWLDPVTDAGVKELARPDSGLKSLTTLNLCWTELTDAGLKEMARPDSGLRGLTTLDISHTNVTDAGLRELARPDSGLAGLTTIQVRGPKSKVTLAGIAELQKARPGLRIVQ